MFETITTIVTIGKSKKEIAYTFLKSDFVRIEGDRLILKNDQRVLKVEFEDVAGILKQLNNNDKF